MSSLIHGLDLSNIQGTVDFKAVAATGVQFVILRCGVGNDGIDNLYSSNVAAAKAAGLKVMAYHFVYPLPTTLAEPSRAPQAQAQAHAIAAKGELAACDLEWPTSDEWAKWGCTATQIAQWTLSYLQAYEQITGIKPLIYTYPNFAESVKLPANFGTDYKLWIASYEPTPTIPAPWTDWVLWQDTDTGKLPNGVTVDTDKARDLSLWDPPAPIPAPVPVPVPTPNPTPIPAPTPAPIPEPSSISVWTNLINAILSLFKR